MNEFDGNVWDVLSLDVWGNADDGWEVNAAYFTGTRIEFDSIDDEKAIVDALIEADILIPGASADGLEIEGDEYMLFISDVEDGCPIVHLQHLHKN